MKHRVKWGLGTAPWPGADGRLLGQLVRRGARVGLLRRSGHVARPGRGRRNVEPVCGNVRLFVGRWHLDRVTGPGSRRFLRNAAWDRKPNWRRDGDGSECGFQTGVGRGKW
jgi:hypothetical protein